MAKSSKRLFISSCEPYSGKSAFCLGLGLILKERGMRVGYMKPVGNLLTEYNNGLTDRDTLHAKEILGLDDPPKLMSPVLLTHELIDNALKGRKPAKQRTIRNAYAKVSKGKDYMLFEGAGDVGGGSMIGLSDVDVAKMLKTRILLLSRYDSVYAVDRVLNDVMFVKKKVKCAGVVFNNVPASELKTVKTIVTSFLDDKGIKTIGVLPQDEIMQSVSVSDLRVKLNAKELVKGDGLIKSFVVGAMSPGHAMKYFRQVSDKAVITGGDRSDILLAALETPTKCLILTGDLTPDEKVISKAEAKNVPVISTSHDTATTVQISESLVSRLSVTSNQKLKRVRELILKNVDVDALL
ncbi:MAG: phosphotransacetylase family protein [Candidatus Altiarchaeota archaeon]